MVDKAKYEPMFARRGRSQSERDFDTYGDTPRIELWRIAQTVTCVIY